MASRLCDVLVVGAGPVGLMLAGELRRRGLAVELIDALPAPTDQSRATDLQPRSLELLDLTGQIEAFLGVGRQVRGVRFVSDDREVFRLGFEGLESPYPFLLSLPQPVTESLLHERLRALGGAVRRGARLVSFEERPDHVLAVVDDEGGSTWWRARWLVGCDGAGSTVRAQLGVPFAGLSYEESFVIADVHVAGGFASDEITLYMPSGGFLTVLALPGEGVFRLFFDAPPGLTEAPTLAELQALVAARAGPAARLTALRWVSVFRIQQRLVNRMRVGRVFLAGNAAHIHSPAGGQGMNTGLQDALNLAWKLALVCRGLATDALLDTYHDERHPVAESLLLSTDVATRSTMLRSPLARALRDAGARLTASVGPLAHRIEQRCAELDLVYEQGPAVGEQHAPLWRAPVRSDRTREAASLSDRARFGRGPHAGERAPDVAGLHLGDPAAGPQGQTVALRDLLRHPGFTLLLFDGEAATASGYENLRRVAERARHWLGEHVTTHVILRGAPPRALAAGQVLDPWGKLHERYGASSECLYLIRPDGYVGFRCQPADADALSEFLAGMLRLAPGHGA